ncbi:probable ATP-dependent RNA helicase DHX37 [Limulus polyphemus]|uniref:Probable ATP-dependent RNA helicase DHX37 n=1 Tax=Limulus polyphemus TaxID=6850 RepID=A0ABM1BYJ0_LIMPO|nr:probable ATP-dependent RNA helicase DHX37 [Limulus polyphemus]
MGPIPAATGRYCVETCQYGYLYKLQLDHQSLRAPCLQLQQAFLKYTATFQDQKLKDRHQQWVQIKRTWAGEGHSLALGDIMVLLKAVGAAEFVGCTSWFCEQHGLRYKAMIEIRKMRTQLTNEVNLVIPDVNLFVDPKMTPPTPLQIKLLRQVILTGFADHIARRIPKTDIKDDEKIKLKNAYQSIEVETPVFIHHSSVLHKEAPEYVVYQEIFRNKQALYESCCSC